MANIQLLKSDIEILIALYKWGFLKEYQIALLMDESVDYIRGRLKRMSQTGVIKRKCIIPNTAAANWITNKGIQMIDVPIRNVYTPKAITFEHDAFCADFQIWLMKNVRLTSDNIVTERDIRTHYVQNKDSGIHIPDGFISSNVRIALEFERTLKSSPKKTVLENIEANRQRFHAQYWAVDRSAVRSVIQEILQDKEYKNEIQIYDRQRIEFDLKQYISELPHYNSERIGKKRRSLINVNWHEPVALMDLPVRKDVCVDASMERWEEDI